MMRDICGIERWLRDVHQASLRDAAYWVAPSPWVETHGYRHKVAPRREETYGYHRAVAPRPTYPIRFRTETIPCRRATIDGSRGFQPTEYGTKIKPRRVATFRTKQWPTPTPTRIFILCAAGSVITCIFLRIFLWRLRVVSLGWRGERRGSRCETAPPETWRLSAVFGTLHAVRAVVSRHYAGLGERAGNALAGA